MRRVRAIVTGRVQGVAYRASTAHEATRLALAGWVCNRPDGSVELEAEGPSDSVDQLLAWCAHGPPSARVTNVAVEELTASGTESTFSVRKPDSR